MQMTFAVPTQQDKATPVERPSHRSSMPIINAPQLMTEREWEDRLARSRHALGSWTWEASLWEASLSLDNRNLMRCFVRTVQ